MIFSIHKQGEDMRKILSIITIVLLTVVICSTQSFSQTGKWTQMFPANSPPARSSNGIAYLGDDKILIFGGWKLHEQVLGDTWIYDLSDNEWTEVKCDTSPRARELPAMVHIADGKVLLFGGYLGWDFDLGSDTWIFDLKTMKWKELFPARYPAARERPVCAFYEENKALLYSGFGALGFCDDTWTYDLGKNEWDSITYHYPRGRELAQMCEINNNDFALYSGNTASYKTSTPDVFIFSKNIKTWRKINLIKPNKYRDATSMVKLIDNVAFVFGGNSEDPGQTSDDNWLLLIKDSTWIQLNLENHPERRYYNYMTTIGEGKALLFGGIGYSSDLNDTWLFEYDPTGMN
jgi:N-acetylneuraminic acid mutarotase